MTNKIYFIPVFLIILLNSDIHSQVSFTGYGATGLQFFQRQTVFGPTQEVYFEGKLQTDIKINKDIEAQLDFRGNSEDNQVVLREFSAKFEYWERMKLEIGNLKQPFGTEQMIKDEDFELTDESFIQDQLSDFGYAERSVSLMLYSKYKDEYKDFPFSYYLSFFKNNSLASGLYTRLSYHNNDFIYSVNYSYQSIGGDYPVKAHGFTGDITFSPKRTTVIVEGLYVKNTELVLQQVMLEGDQEIYAGGAKILGARKFKIDGKIVKDLEPVILFGYFVPDFSETEFHTLQVVPGINVYVHNDVRLRFNYSLLLTKNRFNTDYSISNSVGTIEVQVRY